jgi:polygalacturonase
VLACMHAAPGFPASMLSRAVEHDRRMMNVKDFGAKGNGTYATEAFQKAADAVPASGGVLYIPAGQPLRPEHCSASAACAQEAQHTPVLTAQA